jgi:oxygen-independent coproporphyrinogen III oxidase
MDAELLAKYDRPVPRYTSYPTAPHFHAGIGPDDYRGWLAELPTAAKLSLYLHVPFCQELCWYCGCHTTVARRYQPVAEYRALLVRELDFAAAALGGRRRVGHIHFGGGTPTMLAPDDLRALGERLRARFEVLDDGEFAVEIDPRRLTRETVAALAAVGVNRASLGVQDVNPEVQQAINRWQPFTVVERAVDWLRMAGIDGINFDLMYGLPRQTTAGVRNSVDAALTLRPSRVALFGYAHVPWMKRHQRLIDEASLPDAGERAAQFEVAAERLEQAGYVAIGLDHFALPDDSLVVAQREGRLHRNFQGYTTDDARVLLGFGASAIGALPQGYVQNAVPIPDYRAAMRKGHLATARGVRSSADDRLRRGIIERLMCDFAVDLDDAAGGLTAELAALEPYQADGLLTIDDRMIRVEPEGRPLIRTICAVFDGYLDRGLARHSRAVRTEPSRSAARLSEEAP